MSCLCVFRSWKRGSKKLKFVIIKTETKRRTKIYHHEVFTERTERFCSVEYEEVTTDKIKACQNYCKEHRNCDVLVSEQDPSCSSIDLLLSLTIIHIRFTNDLSRKSLFPEISSFSKISDISGIPSNQSFSVVSKLSRNVMHLFSQEVCQQRICYD